MSGGSGTQAPGRLGEPPEVCAGCVRLEQRVAALEAQLGRLENLRPVVRPSRPATRARGRRWQPTEDTPLLREYFECRQLEWQRSRGKCRMEFVHGDLVMAAEAVKVHFVSGDFKRSKGVALDFATSFGPVIMKKESYDVGEIKLQRKDETVLLNAVSKKRAANRLSDNPEAFLSGVVTALQSIRDYCRDKGVGRIAMVRLGAGLDRVHWRWTQQKLLEIFEGLDVVLAVYIRPRRWRRRETELQLQPPPSLDDLRHFPPPGGRGRRRGRGAVAGAERHVTGLRPGQVADACDGLVLARRPEVPKEPSARPEASADGRSASAGPVPAQVSSAIVTHLADLPPAAAVSQTHALSPSAPLVDLTAGQVLLQLDPLDVHVKDVDVPALDGRGAGVLTGSQGEGASRRSLAWEREPGASTKTASTVTGFVPAVPGLAPTHLVLPGEPLNLISTAPSIHVLAGGTGSLPEVSAHSQSGDVLDGLDDGEHDRNDDSLLLLHSPEEREAAPLAPPPGHLGSAF
jgi:hypothetical protein